METVPPIQSLCRSAEGRDGFQQSSFAVLQLSIYPIRPTIVCCGARIDFAHLELVRGEKRVASSRQGELQQKFQQNNTQEYYIILMKVTTNRNPSARAEV